MGITRYYASFNDDAMLMGKQDFDMKWAFAHYNLSYLQHLHTINGFSTISSAKRCPGYKSSGTGIIEINYNNGTWTIRRVA